MERRRRKELQRLAGAFRREIARILSRLQGTEISDFPLRLEDSIRLLNLQVWSRRYQVPLEFILETLLIGYYGRVRRNRYGLGLRVATLCGERSRMILEERIRKKFPHKENQQQWKKSQQELIQLREIGTGIFRLYGKSPLEFCQDYQQAVTRQRARYEKLEEKLPRRPWRGNPWR